jgi:peptidoglycan/xylan/chitin deacetylase (PgdA/CDA1 family)
MESGKAPTSRTPTNAPLWARPEASSDALAQPRRPTSAPTAPAGANPPLALLSFDVEQFDIPTEYGIEIPVDRQFEIGRAGLATVLELLDRHEAPATFFITAEFALRYPKLTRSIADRKRHEIGSHGYTHGELEKGHLEESRLALEKVTGEEVRGFRRARMAPTDAYALAAAGYTYNAGENPIWLPGRYNHFFQPRRARVVPTPGGPLVQIPCSATPLLRVPLFWLAFKNLPPWAIKLASRWVLAADGALNTYFHPWEFTEIESYALPPVVKKIDGRALRERLSAYILWLQERATLSTYGALAERVARGVPRGRRI